MTRTRGTHVVRRRAVWAAGLRGALVVTGAVAVGLAGQAGVARAPGTAAGATYTLAPGDTLSSVARSLGVSVASLAAANGITDVHRVRSGTRLVVPAGRTARGAPTPSPARAAARPPARLPERLRQAPARLALLPHFDAAARAAGVPADLLKAVAWQESGWQNDKVSATAAVGIGQLMPATVAFVNDVLLRQRLDPRVAEQNIALSARFLAYLLRQTDGDVPTALAAYYQGLASVRRQGPLPTTRRYVAAVVALRQKF